MKARRDTTRLRTGLAAGAAVALAVGLLQASGVLEVWELRTRDLRTKWTIPSELGHPDIVIMLITNDSIQWAEESRQRWPWDRQLFADMFRACSRKDARAQAILFDLLTLIDSKPDEAVLVDEMKTAPPAWLAVPYGKVRDKRPPKEFDALLSRYAVEVDSDGSVALPEAGEGVQFPRPGIAEAAAGVCDVASPRDGDGLIRRYRLFSKFRGRYYPSMMLGGLLTREGTRRVVVRDRTATVGKVSIPLDAEGCFHLRFYRKDDSFPLLPASRVIKGIWDIEEKGSSREFDPQKVKDRIVIVGTDAPALFDLRVTPVSEAMPGCELHAVALTNVLRGEFLRTVPRVLSFVVLALLALGTALVTRHASAVAGGAAAVALLGVGLGGGVLLYRAGWIVDLVAPFLGMGFSYAAGSALNFLYEGRQKLKVKREFQRYLSPKVVEKILRNPDALSMAGERKMLSIFFMDFAGFTSLSETVEPAELVQLVSEYHNEAAQEIFRTEGTLDKFIGDAIMAFWNDPIEQADHATRACLTAVSAQARLRELAARMRARGLPEMSARIGVNTGLATVGNMGAKGQVNYTLIGDEVNLASRLEGVNKEFGTKIIVSEATYLPAKDRVEARELAVIKVKGKKQGVRIYELLGVKGEVPADRLEAARRFEKGLETFRARKFGAAWEIFLSSHQAGDTAADPYVALCEEYQAAPPPPDWDGAYQMTHK